MVVSKQPQVVTCISDSTIISEDIRFRTMDIKDKTNILQDTIKPKTKVLTPGPTTLLSESCFDNIESLGDN